METWPSVGSATSIVVPPAAHGPVRPPPVQFSDRRFQPIEQLQQLRSPPVRPGQQRQRLQLLSSRLAPQLRLPLQALIQRQRLKISEQSYSVAR
jgi:hypothetical protein